MEHIKFENDVDVIKLNVGGKVFTTTMGTLSKPIITVPGMSYDPPDYKPISNRKTQNPKNANLPRGQGHLLKRLFENNAYDKDNLLFIDRNPKFFGIVLDYLRTTDMTLESFFKEYAKKYDELTRHLKLCKIEAVKNDFKFFGIYD